MSRNHALPQPPNEAAASPMPSATPPASPEAPVKMPKKSIPFDKKSRLALLLAFGQAVLSSFIFYPYDAMEFGSLPGVGLTIMTVAVLACAFAILGKHARIDRVTIPLTVTCLILALIPALYANPDLRFLNCLILGGTLTLDVFLVANLWEGCWASSRAVGASIWFFFVALFSNLLGPLNALAHRSRGKDGRVHGLQGVAAGIGIALGLLVILIIPLLASADAMFSQIFSRIFDLLAHLRFDRIVTHLTIVLIVTPLAFSLLWAASHARSNPHASAGEDALPDASSRRIALRIPAATQVIVLISVDIVYLVFVAVQFINLFGGTESVHMYGGYAEYARTGFFQLATVGIINACIGLLAAQGAGHAQSIGSRAALAIGNVALVLMTAVILASAAMRMNLYIQEYGLTLMRLLTLLGMAFTAVLLAALLVKTFHAKTNFFRIFMIAGLALWICFNFMNIDKLIVRYNVAQYESGAIENVDAWYLSMHTNADTLSDLQALETYLRTKSDANEKLHLGDNLNYGDSYEYEADILKDRIIAYEDSRTREPWPLWSWAHRA